MSARVDVDGHDLVVTIGGPARYLGLRRSVRVPIADVTSAEAVPRGSLRPPLVMLGAFSVPGVLVAGVLWRRGGKELWAVGRPDRMLVVHTKGTYARLVLEVDDPEGDATRILAGR